MFECCVNLGMCEGECCDLMNVVCMWVSCGRVVESFCKQELGVVGFTALCALKSV